MELLAAEEVQLDWRVLLIAIAASVLSGLLFGLAPALRAPARELEQALRAGGRTMPGAPFFYGLGTDPAAGFPGRGAGVTRRIGAPAIKPASVSVDRKT